MASGTTDLQRDLGGALMQSIFGALLAAGFASAMGAAVAASPESADATASITSQLEMSYASAASIAQQYPQYATQITDAAKSSFLAGDQNAYIAGIIAILIGLTIVLLKYPKPEQEKKDLMQYHTEDAAAAPALAPKDVPAPTGVTAQG